MGLLDEANSVIQRHQELCHDLNMDKDAADQAWQSYEKIRHNYILEGDPLHWIACALYVACRNTTVPTVGATDAKIEGNRVSLTRLLRSCKLSLIQFFNKVKKWLDMANVSSELRTKIDCLERNFSVSMVIFKKFQPIFKDMFRDPADDPPRLPRSRKTRRAPCTPSEVFDFCWTLFVCVKAAFPAISDDLVNSYHLLLACCDLMFGNALLADRRDLLNFNFSGLPRNFLQQDYKMATDPPCIIDQLCEKHEGIKLEAKGIKEYCWKPHMRELFEKKFLKGDGINFTGLLELGCFEFNFKSIKKTYEEYVLNVGDFDETIFLGDDANTEIGTPTKISNQNGIDEFQEKLKAKRNLQHFDGAHHLVPSTPLTGRKYLKAKDNSKITPISTATQSVSRLQTLLSGRQATPSDALFEILRSCERKQDVRIEEKVKEMGSLFCTKYTQADDHQPGSHIDFARKRLQLGQSLYYKLLENILSEEKKKKPGFDLTHLLEQDVFLQSLFACCLEIVIFSYNSQRTFPWIVEAFNLEPYHFYKVIEIIVRAEDGLSRDMVKHLNLIEEQILESMAWKGGSPLWENIRNSGLPIPSCEEVSLPSQLMIKEEPLNSDSQPMSPLHNPSICRLTNMDRPTIKNPQQSPVSSVDRFQSPIQPSLAKKRLFADAPASTTATTVTCASPQVTALVAAIKPGQSLLQSPGKTMAFNIQTIQGENGERYIPISHIQGSGSVIIQAQHTQPFTAITGKNLNSATQNNNNNNTIIDKRIKKPKRTGSLGLFFRKFYSLAAIRMQELCSHLKVTDDELRRKIWTCFEHTIIQHTDLMQDRHLDQILMCAVYVICKVTQHERTFTDIMKCYRYQPQARSHVYRSVLLCTKKRRGSGSSSNGASSTSSPAPSDREDAENKEEPNERIRSCSTLSVTHPPSAPPTPTHLAGTSTSFENEDRGDLIKFYNEVYVQKIQDFVLKFSGKINQNDALTLSPLPPSKMQPMSPCRRVSDKHSVYIRSLTPRCIPASPTQPFSYSFHRSPAKDLDTINNMIQLDSRKVGKRLLADDNSDADAPQAKQPALVTRKLHDLIGDRLGKTQD